MRAGLLSTVFDFQNLNDLLALVGKGAKEENVFGLALREIDRFRYGYVERQVYWH